MSLQRYKHINFTQPKLELIEVCNDIIRDYQRQGYTMSVRQLYYQLVARDAIENTVQSYKRIADTINDARMAGLVRWDAIEDRTREFVQRQRWTSPRQIMQASYDSYHMDMWLNQAVRIFVIVEKEALVGVLDPSCRKYDVPLLAARGYPSSSVMREFAIGPVRAALDEEKDVIILHLGDHDPSGIDMTRDLDEKINLFSESASYDNYVTIERIALTMDQIDDQRPPPNPAKTTDSRFASYSEIYGHQSWELDALRPQFIDNLVSSHIESFRDDHAWDARAKFVAGLRAELATMMKRVSGNTEVEAMMDKQEEDDE